MSSFSRPQLPPKCSEAVFNPARLSLTEWCAPKSLRLETGFAWLVEQAFGGLAGQNFWWTGPDFGQAMSAMNVLKSSLTAGAYRQMPRATALTLMNGANIWFRSAETPNQLYSDSIRALVIDQAIQIDSRAWKALQESTTLTGAPLRILSTCGDQDHWFHQLGDEIQENPNPTLSHYCRFTAQDAINYSLLDANELQYAKSSLPDYVFRAMYNCESYNTQVEAAHQVGDPRLMTDQELALVAGITDNWNSLSDEQLQELSDRGFAGN